METQLAGRRAVSFVTTAGTKARGKEPGRWLRASPDLNAFSLTHHSAQGCGPQIPPDRPDLRMETLTARADGGGSLVLGTQPGPPAPSSDPAAGVRERDGVGGDPGREKRVARTRTRSRQSRGFLCRTRCSRGRTRRQEMTVRGPGAVGAQEAPRGAHPERPRGRRTDTARFFLQPAGFGEPWAQTGALGVFSARPEAGMSPPQQRGREDRGKPSAGDDLSWAY